MDIKTYLSQIEKALLAGNATEHTHRPALKSLVESIDAKITATNEPKRVKCGAPDYIITRKGVPLGYIEAKDVGVSLNEVEKSDQLGRYKESLANLILTDYLEFRWFVDGEHRMTARLATSDSKGKLRQDKEGVEKVRQMLTQFLAEQVSTIKAPKELASRMAAIAQLVRDSIKTAFHEEDLTDNKPDPLHDQLNGFRKVLLHDLTPDQFADMYAQTICYGMFAARCNAPAVAFTRQHAAYELPKTNPFLRKMFTHIAGPDLDERISWAVDDLAELLNRADMAAILKDFGKHTRQEDPVVHFYETFLKHYDPKMREARGVYYTPEPVVSYIVRSVDHILKTEFGLQDGLADSSKISLTRGKGKNKETIETHKVQILDPATGTGTFLYRVIDQIHESFAGNKGMWSGYVREHLLPRVNGFELLMAPYAVAHMKLGLQLAETGYDFNSDERLRVYLTNTLEEAHEMYNLPLFTQWLADEANSAAKVKQEVPIMVVLGNPPYSYVSENVGPWISELIRDYYKVDGQPLGERNPKGLQDDYVKFIRFAQWRIEQTGYGVLAFITNHGYLDNPTFRGMRQSLMKTFDDIYILDLHGSALKREKAPDGSKDENVFDIQQGVAIGIFVKKQAPSKKAANVRHADLYGLREAKYQWLWENELSTTKWKEAKPQTPFYLYAPQNMTLLTEYEQGWQIIDIMATNSAGLYTGRDNLTIQSTQEAVKRLLKNFIALEPERARETYNLGPDSRDWQIKLAQQDIRASEIKENKIQPINYRPFDNRYTYYTGVSRGFLCMPRPEIMHHMLSGPNIGLIANRQIRMDKIQHTWVSKQIVEYHILETANANAYLFPLYLYPAKEEKGKQKTLLETTPWPAGKEGRRPNLSPEFVRAFSAKLKMTFVPDGKGDLKKQFGPEDIFNYMYAVFHSPTFRSRYAEFLKIDFPRLPLTGNVKLFRELCGLGEELVALHLMEKDGPKLTRFPMAGDNLVEKVTYEENKVFINKTQYFEGVPPEVWNFHVGGYQVLQKWLKDRKDRQLTYDDLTHYQAVVSALSETIRLMKEIDEVIEKHGGWPIK